MRNVLRDIAWCVQDVLEAWWPLERAPSMWDLEADALADKEAEEEVAEAAWPTQAQKDELREILAGEPVDLNKLTPAQARIAMGLPPLPQEPDRLDHLTALVEDIRNILQSSVALVSAEAATERPAPDSAIPPAPGAGHSNPNFFRGWFR